MNWRLRPLSHVHKSPFDTLEAARRLEAAGIQAEQADGIVEVVNQSASQMVTVERFETGITGLHARIDSVHSDLSVRIDSVHSDLSVRIDSVQSDLGVRIGSMQSDLSARIDSVHSELTVRIDSDLSVRIDSVHSRLSARIDALHNKIDSVQAELLARIDSVRAELRADLFRSLMLAVGILIAANTLMASIFGILLTNGAFGTVTFGAP